MSKRNRERRSRNTTGDAAATIKAKLRAAGCVLPFYEVLDSCEGEFRRIVKWAGKKCLSLYGVFEVPPSLLQDQPPWQQLGLPGDWKQILFEIGETAAESYLSKVDNANLRGCTSFHCDSAGAYHSVIRVPETLTKNSSQREQEYLVKIAALLHEIGHAWDFECEANFRAVNHDVDIIEAEVFANLFALDECFRRACFLSGEFLLGAMYEHKDDQGYLGKVARRVIARFNKPNYRKWTDVQIP